MNKHHPIDTRFKEQLQGLKVAPSEKSWQQLQAKLAEQKGGNHTNGYSRWSTLLALVVLPGLLLLTAADSYAPVKRAASFELPQITPTASTQAAATPARAEIAHAPTIELQIADVSTAAANVSVEVQLKNIEKISRVRLSPERTEKAAAAPSELPAVDETSLLAEQDAQAEAFLAAEIDSLLQPPTLAAPPAPRQQVVVEIWLTPREDAPQSDQAAPEPKKLNQLLYKLYQWKIRNE